MVARQVSRTTIARRLPLISQQWPKPATSKENAPLAYVGIVQYFLKQLKASSPLSCSRDNKFWDKCVIVVPLCGSTLYPIHACVLQNPQQEACQCEILVRSSGIGEQPITVRLRVPEANDALE